MVSVPQVQKNILYRVEGKCCCVDFFNMGFTFFIPMRKKYIIGTLASPCYQEVVQKFCDINTILQMLTSAWRKKFGNISV